MTFISFCIFFCYGRIAGEDLWARNGGTFPSRGFDYDVIDAYSRVHVRTSLRSNSRLPSFWSEHVLLHNSHSGSNTF